jgi:hypothetical protein
MPASNGANSERASMAADTAHTVATLHPRRRMTLVGKLRITAHISGQTAA